MSKIITKGWIAILAIFLMVFVSGCGNNEDKKKETKSSPAEVATNVVTAPPAVTSAPPAVASTAPVEAAKEVSTKEIDMRYVAAIVDGKVLKKSAVKKDMKKMMAMYKDRIPKDKVKEAQAEMKKQIIDEFVLRTLLNNEIEKKNIKATDEDIKTTAKHFEDGLKDKKMEDFLKENKITKEKFNEEIAFSVKVKQLITQELGGKENVTPNEVSKFYTENKDKFTEPESSHVRHILVKLEPTDDEKIKGEKKAKIAAIRKQLVGGADFAELAKKDSDCPSKEKGGDLGFIKKGDTVKQFEDAAFSQQKNAIGPVVETQFGYHILQVLERKAQKTVKLEDVKKNITTYLENQKKQEAVNSLIKRLRAQAKITINEK